MTLYLNPDDYPDVDPDDLEQLQRAGTTELLQAFRGLKPLKAKDVTMEGVTLVVPFGNVNVTIALDSVSLDFSVLAFGPEAAKDPTVEDRYWQVPLHTLSSFRCDQTEWMYTKGVHLYGISLKTPSAFKGKPGTFEIFTERNTVDWQNITVAGYSEIEGKYYMIVDAEGVGGDRRITIPGADTEMVIKSGDIDMDYVQMWAFLVTSPNTFLDSEEITGDNEIIMKGVNLDDLTIKLVYTHAEGVTMRNVSQEVFCT